MNPKLELLIKLTLTKELFKVLDVSNDNNIPCEEKGLLDEFLHQCQELTKISYVFRKEVNAYFTGEFSSSQSRERFLNDRVNIAVLLQAEYTLKGERIESGFAGKYINYLEGIDMTNPLSREVLRSLNEGIKSCSNLDTFITILRTISEFKDEP